VSNAVVIEENRPGVPPEQRCRAISVDCDGEVGFLGHVLLSRFADYHHVSALIDQGCTGSVGLFPNDDEPAMVEHPAFVGRGAMALEMEVAASRGVAQHTYIFNHLTGLWSYNYVHDLRYEVDLLGEGVRP